jgi:hypothetical protein
MASIGELFIELGVKADTSAISKVGAGIKSLRSNLLLVAGAFTGAVVGLDRFVDSALKGVVALQNINAQTGLSIEKLQQFQQAGQLSNLALSADQIAQSIGNVQKNLANIRIGQGNIAPFQLFPGVDVAGADVFDIMEQIRDNIHELDPAIATNLITQMGLTPDFINLLKLSRKEFEALSDNTFLSKSQRADIDKVGTSIKALTLRFKALKDQAVAKIAPQLNELVQQFFKWLKDNGDKIVRVIESMARGFANFASAVGNAFALTSRFLENIIGLENGIKILAIAFSFLTLSFSPFLAGLAAIILLLDDIAVFRRGGKSVIGELVKAFEELPDFAKILGGAGLIATIGLVTTGILKMTGAVTGLGAVLPKLAPLAAVVGGAAFVLNAPEIGRKLAAEIDKTERGQKFGDLLLDARNAALGGFEKATNIVNNFTITGVSDTIGVMNVLERDVTPIMQDSLDRTQGSQGNILR